MELRKNYFLKLLVLAIIPVVLFAKFFLAKEWEPPNARIEQEEIATAVTDIENGIAAGLEELVELRQPFSKTYLKEDESHLMVISPVPLHYYDEQTGSYKNINLDIKSDVWDNEFDYSSTENALKTQVASDSKGKIKLYTDQGFSVTMESNKLYEGETTRQASIKDAVLNSEELVYESIFDGVDKAIKTEPYSVKIEYRINDPSFFTDKKAPKIEEIIEFSGIAGIEDANGAGRIMIDDGNGKTFILGSKITVNRRFGSASDGMVGSEEFGNPYDIEMANNSQVTFIDDVELEDLGGGVYGLSLAPPSDITLPDDIEYPVLMSIHMMMTTSNISPDGNTGYARYWKYYYSPGGSYTEYYDKYTNTNPRVSDLVDTYWGDLIRFGGFYRFNTAGLCDYIDVTSLSLHFRLQEGEVWIGSWCTHATSRQSYHATATSRNTSANSCKNTVDETYRYTPYQTVRNTCCLSRETSRGTNRRSSNYSYSRCSQYSYSRCSQYTHSRCSQYSYSRCSRITNYYTSRWTHYYTSRYTCTADNCSRYTGSNYSRNTCSRWYSRNTLYGSDGWGHNYYRSTDYCNSYHWTSWWGDYRWSSWQCDCKYSSWEEASGTTNWESYSRATSYNCDGRYTSYDCDYRYTSYNCDGRYTSYNCDGRYTSYYTYWTSRWRSDYSYNSYWNTNYNTAHSCLYTSRYTDRNTLIFFNTDWTSFWNSCPYTNTCWSAYSRTDYNTNTYYQTSWCEQRTEQDVVVADIVRMYADPAGQGANTVINSCFNRTAIVNDLWMPSGSWMDVNISADASHFENRLQSGYYALGFRDNNTAGGDDIYGSQPTSMFSYSGTYVAVTYTPGTPGLWVGVVNHNWTEPMNWESCSVPTSSVNVVIPTSSSYTYHPYVNSSSCVCNNIQIQSGGILYNQSGTLRAYGTFTNNGTFYGNIGTLRVDSNLYNYSTFNASTGTMTVYGNWRNTSTFNANSGTFVLQGNWDNDGTFNRGSGTVRFAGTSGTNTIGGSSVTTFNKLEIIKTGGSLSVIDNDIRVIDLDVDYSGNVGIQPASKVIHTP